MTQIFEPHNSSFGDQWATVNCLLHMSLMRGEPVHLHHRSPEMGELHAEIVSVLDSPGRLVLTPQPFNAKIDGYSIWSTPYFPTRRRWNFADTHGPLVVQVDGVSVAEQKNPSEAELVRLADVLRELVPDREIVLLGKHLGVSACVELAASAFCFLGVCSGISHLCHSVGVPLFLLEYQLHVVTCHRGKEYRACRGALDFREKLFRWINYLRDIGHPDAV